MKIVIACGVALMVSACGTIVRGSTEDVTFNSSPPGAKVQLSTGLVCNSTPCTFPIGRKQDFVASFSMEGHEPVQIPVTTAVSGGGAAGMAGNLVLGGVVGIVVDASTGATLDHSPNPVFATMLPIKPPEQPPTQRRRGKRSRGQT